MQRVVLVRECQPRKRWPRVRLVFNVIPSPCLCLVARRCCRIVLLVANWPGTREPVDTSRAQWYITVGPGGLIEVPGLRTRAGSDKAGTSAHGLMSSFGFYVYAVTPPCTTGGFQDGVHTATTITLILAKMGENTCGLNRTTTRVETSLSSRVHVCLSEFESDYN